VGLQTGVVDICRLDQPIPTSPTSLSTIQAPVSLSIGSSKRRPCTSLAFCELNPNLLAHGLDKLHTEYSLVIWDLEQSAPSFQASAVDEEFDRLSDPLPNAGGYTSRLHKAVLRAPPPSTVSASTIAAKDLQEFQRVPSRGKGGIYRPVQDQNHPSGQYCQAEGINACVFQANSSWEVVAGVNNRLMRYFDLRVRNKAVRQTPTNAVRGICCDPMDGNLIASLDPEKGVYVWDRRKHTHPILVFQEDDAGHDPDALIMSTTNTVPKISAIEFCNSRRNVLGTTTRDGNCVRLWTLVTGEAYEKEDSGDDDESEITDAVTQAWDVRASGHNSTATPSEELHSSSEDVGPILSATKRSMNPLLV
jgi:WD40 repeat protein